MAKVKRFEDIQSWIKARALAKDIYDATLVGSLAKDFALKDQMRRTQFQFFPTSRKGLNEVATKSSFSS